MHEFVHLTDYDFTDPISGLAIGNGAEGIPDGRRREHLMVAVHRFIDSVSIKNERIAGIEFDRSDREIIRVHKAQRDASFLLEHFDSRSVADDERRFMTAVTVLDRPGA